MFRKLFICLPAIILMFNTFACVSTSEKKTAQFQEVQKTHSVKINFLDRDKAIKRFFDSDSDIYFSQLVELEIKARSQGNVTGSDQQLLQNQFKVHLKNQITDFTQKEKKIIQYYLTQVLVNFNGSFPKLLYSDWNFIRIRNNGFPYTLGDNIVMSDRILKSLEKYMTSGRESRAFWYGQEFLIHEKVHILQRKLQPEFENLYRSIFKFTKDENIELGDWIKRQKLTNPDGIFTNWVYCAKNNDCILPIAIFKSGGEKYPEDLIKVGVEIEKSGNAYRVSENHNGIPDFKVLREIPSYVRMFGYEPNNYHPAELSADYVTISIMLETIPGYRDIRARYYKGVKKLVDETYHWSLEHL